MKASDDASNRSPRRMSNAKNCPACGNTSTYSKRHSMYKLGRFAALRSWIGGLVKRDGRSALSTDGLFASAVFELMDRN